MANFWRKISSMASYTLFGVMGLGLMLLLGGCASDGTYERQSPASSPPSRSGTTPSPSTPSPSPTSPTPAPRTGGGPAD